MVNWLLPVNGYLQQYYDKRVLTELEQFQELNVSQNDFEEKLQW